MVQGFFFDFMSAFLDRVRSTITHHRMLNRGDTVVVAVSGGSDSMALLHALVALRAELELTLQVAHLDHQLRPDSGDDGAFVAGAAESLRLPASLGTADVRVLAAAEKRSIEDAARRARYAFLAAAAADIGATAVATAHTRSDQCETVLMRVLDGAPWELLAGIPPVRALGSTHVVRPLLDVSRREILDYLNTQEIVWREDPTNLDLTMRRNWVRHVALPALEHDVPALLEVLGRIGDSARETDHALWAIAGRLYETIRVHTGDTIRLPLHAVEGREQSLQRRLIRHTLTEAAGTTAFLSRVVEDEATRLLSRRQPGEIPAGSWVVRRSYHTFEVAPAPSPPVDEEYRLPIPGDVAATAFGVTISAAIVAPGEIGALRPDEAFLDAGAVGRVLGIRPWRTGDRFRPLGMQGNKKVQDLLVDQKVPRWERGRIPIVVDTQDRILWVVGQRIAEDGRVRGATERVVRLRVQPLGAKAAADPFA